MAEETFVNLQNARTDRQLQVMQRIQEKGDCPFCLEHLRKYHERPIIKENKHWLLTENNYPYEHTKFHFLLIAKEHCEKLGDVSNDSVVDLWELLQWAEKEYKIEGGAIGVRFGDVRYTGATVRHLHAHLVVGDVDDPNHQSVRFKMSTPKQN